jgi:hypothetical protein
LFGRCALDREITPVRLKVKVGFKRTQLFKERRTKNEVTRGREARECTREVLS